MIPEDAGRGPSAVTVGTFDGVHRGHRMVIDRLVARARERGLRSVLLTFDPHPLRVLNPAAAPSLLTVGDEKLEMLAATGLDEVVVVPFTRGLASLDADEFVNRVLLARLGMRELFIGHDHGFGRGRSGDAAVLGRLGADRGFGVHVVRPVEGRDGRPVSSTAVRRAVAAGDLARAADGLGRPYSVAGRVSRGDARGATLGFRTVNLGEPDAAKLLPPDGVYAVRVQTPAGRYDGMMNLGARPTFGDSRRTLEAHLFDAEGDWYDRRIRIDLVDRLRDVRAFPSPEDLVRQLRQDEAAARVVVRRAEAGIPRATQPVGPQQDA